ncbi:UNVERIFIED_ORG: hypothetical protein M2348_001003 [Sphingomonas sp. R1F5B]
MRWAIAALATCLGNVPFAMAQDGETPIDVEVEAASDWMARGLSQSGGRAALHLAGNWAPAERVAIAAAVTTLRGSARHGGSTLGFVVAPRLAGTVAGWQWSAGLAGHGFNGRGRLAYGEVRGALAGTLGPVQLAIGADYAPPQTAIGGDNLYLHAMLQGAVPGSALTLHAGGGYSLGRARPGESAWRLRPQGDYADLQAGIAHVSRRLTLGLRASGTIGQRVAPLPQMASGLPARREGTRLVAYLRLNALP